MIDLNPDLIKTVLTQKCIDVARNVRRFIFISVNFIEPLQLRAIRTKSLVWATPSLVQGYKLKKHKLNQLDVFLVQYLRLYFLVRIPPQKTDIIPSD